MAGSLAASVRHRPQQFCAASARGGLNRVRSANLSADCVRRGSRGLLASVGSTNFDNRSFRVNDEARLNVIDHAFAAEQSAAFEADLTLAHLASHAEWIKRPVRERLFQWLALTVVAQL